MCGPIVAFWLGRNNNGPIEGGRNVVRGGRDGNVNTRVVKLLPVTKNNDAPAKSSGSMANTDPTVGENETTVNKDSLLRE